MKQRGLFFLFLIALFATSCKVNSDKPKERIEDEHISVIRYDKLLNEYVKFNSLSALQKMNTENMQATKMLIENVLAIGSVDDDHITQKLKAFYSDSTLLSLMSDVETRFPNLNKVERGLTKGFRKLKKEVPEIKVPRIYAQISALNESIVVGDSLLGFSLDKYMGENYPLYKRYYYDYQCRSMSPERIVPDCFIFYLLSEYPIPANDKRTLLDVMLHYGKINYIVEQILEYHSPEDMLSYTEAEKKWCKENRKKIWEYMLNNGHLQATDPMLIREYTKSAPFTAFYGHESPSLLGIWMGAQIVTSYMKHHKKVTLHDLLQMTDYNRMLSESNYNV
ncbi:gliding motility lipoprotein GldB [uncultured Bacteroides sp.]|uniref:gliding motility protein GldB-related protein n=1 Tax=uncultured Bacteroides sp. TaxID=162156 RepID=UPI002AA6F981|nr:gliding motility lipoprotein GldB [uncultured Bacteroides sp.]